MMGTLFMTVLAFVNLWGYSELKAALAITPVAVMAMLVSPLVGRFSDRRPPRAFGVPALVVMAAALYWLCALPAEPDLLGAVWRLALVGAGVGATFPAVSIGSMGSIRGQELGLGSGIVNMSRQVGFAIGVALFVAVFTGAARATQVPRSRSELAPARLTPGHVLSRPFLASASVGPARRSRSRSRCGASRSDVQPPEQVAGGPEAAAVAAAG